MESEILTGRESSQTMRIAIPAEAVEQRPAPKVARPKVAVRKAHAIKEMLAPVEYAMYQQLIQNIYDAAIVTDMDGGVMDINSRAEEFFAYEPEDIRGAYVSDIVCGLTPGVVATIRDNLRDERFTLLEAFCRRKDRSVFPVEIVASELTLGGDRYLCFFTRDITKRREAEEILDRTRNRLAQAERLEMAGSIAGHIAHDFNNLLTPLLAYPDLIKENLSDDSPAVHDLMLMKKSAQQIADINQQLLALSRRGYYEQRVINVNQVIEEVVEVLHRGAAAPGAQIKLDLESNLLNIKGGAEQLVRVITNLCQNAIDAMDGSGEVRIRTGNVYFDSPREGRQVIPTGEYVTVSVADTGAGISEEIMSRIFDPFFTTKKATRQRGSGLGLSVVHGIVEDHNGFVDVDSEVGRGACFTLYFPACRDNVQEDPGEYAIMGTETIMVVDDDQLQIEVVSRILQKLGYTVSTANSGEEAIEKMRRVAPKFPDLVILDMIMAGIDGAETFRLMREINPAQKAVILSGYVASERVESAQDSGAGAYIRKPVTMSRLGIAIRQELIRGESQTLQSALPERKA